MKKNAMTYQLGSDQVTFLRRFFLLSGKFFLAKRGYCGSWRSFFLVLTLAGFALGLHSSGDLHIAAASVSLGLEFWTPKTLQMSSLKAGSA